MQYNNSKRRMKAEQTRQKILDSAEQLFSENEVEAVSVDDIVKGAGIAKGSFYLHFESKDALIIILINERIERVDANYLDFVKSLPAEMPIKEKILALNDLICDVLENEIGSTKMRAMYKAQLSIQSVSHSVSGYQRLLYTIFRDLIQAGLASGELHSDSSADVLAIHMITAIRGITVEWCIRYPDFDYKAQARHHLAFLLNAI